MLSIGEVAARAGLKTSAVRYYERIGLLPAPQRASGRRRYDVKILDRLAIIGYAQSAGFTLREIDRLFEGKPYSARMRALAQAKLAELDGVIARARMMQTLLRTALRCNCLGLEECGKRLRLKPPIVSGRLRAQRP
jgi:MerR family redox-sensitive transcriptional activator SoxR